MCAALELLLSAFNTESFRRGQMPRKEGGSCPLTGHLFYARDKKGVDRKVTLRAEKGSGGPSLPMLSFFWILYLRSAV